MNIFVNKKLRNNLIANYLGSAITIGMPLLTLPIFVNLLGPQAWGLIAFFWLLIGLTTILETGASHALIREIGIRLQTENRVSSSCLIYTYERMYWGVSVLIALILAISANHIVTSWLGNISLSQHTQILSIYAAATVVFFALSNSLYRSIFIASKAQVNLNILTSLITIFRYGGAASLIYFYPNILLYFGWQIATFLIEFVLLRGSALKLLPRLNSKPKFKFHELSSTFSHASKLISSTLLWAVTLQLDKIIVSMLLPLEEFGYYSIASSLSLGSLRLIYPIQNALLPHLLESPQNEKASVPYILNSYMMIGVIWLLILVGFNLWGATILAKWLHNDLIANNLDTPLMILLIGSALNSLYGITYVVLLVNSKSKRILIINFVFLITSLVSIPILTINYGVIGAASSWLLLNIVGLLFSLPIFRLALSGINQWRANKF